MGGKKAKWEKARARAEDLAQDHRVESLAGALCGRLALDRREADSVDLARLFTEVDMAGDIDIDKTVLLAHLEETTVIAAGLILRLFNEGRVTDAHRLVVLFSATYIGDGDYASLIPSA